MCPPTDHGYRRGVGTSARLYTDLSLGHYSGNFCMKKQSGIFQDIRSLCMF